MPFVGLVVPDPEVDHYWIQMARFTRRRCKLVLWIEHTTLTKQEAKHEHACDSTGAVF